jgi:hypothetical protein
MNTSIKGCKKGRNPIMNNNRGFTCTHFQNTVFSSKKKVFKNPYFKKPVFKNLYFGGFCPFGLLLWFFS